MRTRFGVVLTVALVAAQTACDNATSPSAGLNASVGNGVVLSSTGGGKAQLPPSFGVLEFAFNAKLKGDGSANGEFHQHRERNGLIVDFSGEVTCMAVDDVNHRAWIGGTVKENNSTDPAYMTAIHQPGSDLWFRVVDYGEGNDDPADRTTVLGFKTVAVPTSAVYCANKAWAAGDANTYPLIEGNIQVRAK